MTPTLIELVDHRLRDGLREEWARRRHEPLEGLPRGVPVVLVGQRAAGKTTLLPHVATLLGRVGVDLDGVLERTSGRSIREWFAADERGFREAERASFSMLRRTNGVIAVGGGFLSLHAEALRGCIAVEVPITFDTYSERLRADPTRPRLRPELTFSEELREVFGERERRHAAARPMSFVEFLLRVERGTRSRRVVTLPPNEAIEPFAWRARHVGADLLEIRTDLHPPQLDLLAASRALPLLVAERGTPIAEAWSRIAELRDVERGTGPATLHSHHAPQPLPALEAFKRWSDTPVGAHIKHVEPLGPPDSFPRLLETQVRLIERFGEGHVTVLATGAQALPFRAILNRRNALDYCALDTTWRAAPGQRLLADAAREARSGATTTRARLGILGSTIAHSRSPRIHPQPFDRIELPPDTDVVALTNALRPHYRGFAVTNPFKKRFGAEAINTLIRDGETFRSSNTDVAGARAMWDALGKPKKLIALGDGGATAALRALPTRLEVVTRETLEQSPHQTGEVAAATSEAATRQVVTHGSVDAAPREVAVESARRPALSGTIVWTWPADVEVPASLHFSPGTRVAVIAYGPPAHQIAAEIRARGGEPVRLGPRWFIAQARQQRTTWESAS